MFNYPPKHTIRLKGSLKKFGKEHQVAGYTAADCIRGLATQMPELYHAIWQGHFTIVQRTANYKEYLDLDAALRQQLSKRTPQIIEIKPVIIGAGANPNDKDANIGMIVGGALLLVAAIVVGVFTFGTGTVALGTVAGTLLANALVGVAMTGMSLMFTGISNLLAQQEEDKNKETKYSMTGAGNISRQGVAIPLVYGQVGAGSVMVSNRNDNLYGTLAFPFNTPMAGLSSTILLTDLISEGEIYGLVDDKKSILFDKIPLESENGKLSYSNVGLVFHNGVNNGIDPYSDGTDYSVNVQSKMEDEIWQQFTVTDPNVDSIYLTIKYPSGLYFTNSKGKDDWVTNRWDVQVAGADLVWENALLGSGEIEADVWELIPEPQIIQLSGSVGFTGGDADMGQRDVWVRGCYYDYNGDLKQISEHVSLGYTAYNGEVITRTKIVHDAGRKVKKIVPHETSGSFYVRAFTKTVLELTVKIDISHLDRTKVRYFRAKWYKSYKDDKQGNSSANIVSYSEHIDVKVNYEGRAIAYMQLKADDFKGNMPSRIYEVKGLIIDVPSNYNPETRQYNGIWDGTYKKAWTNNPVWVFYDLLTNKKYGLGRYIPKENVDKWSLYYAAMYCDELVDDGSGGREPRFTFNGVINSREDAFTVLENVAGVFRSMIYAAKGSVFIAQDAPQPVKRVFGQANVIEGKFNYEGTSMQSRHSVVEVQWINPELGWEPDIELYEDDKLIQKYGYNMKKVTALGCTSRGQAHRIARHTIYTEEFENDTVSFSVGLMDSDLRPGDIIYIQDPMITNSTLSGLSVKVLSNTIQLDREVTLKPGSSYQILITDSEGNCYAKNLINNVLNTDTVYLPINESFSKSELEKFQSGCFWILQSDEIQARKFRVLSIKEDSSDEKRGVVFTVMALLHYDEKFKYIDESIDFTRPPINAIPDGELGTPSYMMASPVLRKNDDGSVRVDVVIDWNFPADIRVSGVEVRVSYPNNTSGSFVDYGIMTATQLSIENAGEGEIIVYFRSYSQSLDIYSQEVAFAYPIESIYEMPPVPENLTVETIAGIATFKWSPPPYPFPLNYEYYFITPNGVDTPVLTKSNSATISRTFDRYPATIEFYVKSVNELGKESDYVREIVEVEAISGTQEDLKTLIGNIDSTWLTTETQQLLGNDGLIDKLAAALLREESYTVRLQDKTDESLALAFRNISALATDLDATATDLTVLGAFTGKQLPSNDPDKFGLLWYDGSDPLYPKTPNPAYNRELEISVTNYPYLPVYPSESLFGKLSEVYSRGDFVSAQEVTALEVRLGNTIGKIQEEMLVAVDATGNVKANYAIKIGGVNKDGQPIISGFGLEADGNKSQFGVYADRFFIEDPKWKEGNSAYDRFLFFTDAQTGITYIGTRKTIYNGSLQSINYVANKSGFIIDGVNQFSSFHSTNSEVEISNKANLTIYRKLNNIKYPIAEFGTNLSFQSPYSPMSSIGNKKLKDSALIVKSKENLFNTSYFNSPESENSGLIINGGTYAIKDITNENANITLYMGNTQEKTVRGEIHINNWYPCHVFQGYMRHVPIYIKFKAGGYQNHEIGYANQALGFVIYTVLNELIDAPVGVQISTPPPAICWSTSNAGLEHLYNEFRIPEYVIWTKVLTSKTDPNKNLYADTNCVKAPLGNSTGQYQWVMTYSGGSQFGEDGQRNRFRACFFTQVAGWRSSYITAAHAATSANDFALTGFWAINKEGKYKGQNNGQKPSSLRSIQFTAAQCNAGANYPATIIPYDLYINGRKSSTTDWKNYVRNHYLFG